VEDEENERELLAGYLRLAGFLVDTAGDGCDALDHLHAGERPDVVLLDMGLPRCDGATTACEIRRDPACSGLEIFARRFYLRSVKSAVCVGLWPDDYLWRHETRFASPCHAPFSSSRGPQGGISDSKEEIHKVLGGNLLRAFRQVEEVAQARKNH